ncbi:MAG: hypothetical protein V8S99_07880 [Oscillospiraceae bacterium]
MSGRASGRSSGAGSSGSGAGAGGCSACGCCVFFGRAKITTAASPAAASTPPAIRL